MANRLPTERNHHHHLHTRASHVVADQLSLGARPVGLLVRARRPCVRFQSSVSLCQQSKEAMGGEVGSPAGTRCVTKDRLPHGVECSATACRCGAPSSTSKRVGPRYHRMAGTPRYSRHARGKYRPAEKSRRVGWGTQLTKRITFLQRHLVALLQLDIEKAARRAHHGAAPLDSDMI